MRWVIFPVLGILVLAGLAFFHGGISGRAIDALIKTPIVEGEPLEGNLIFDLAGVPVDSEFVLRLNDQKFTKPVSGLSDTFPGVEEVNFYPEVLLVLEYVPGGDASDFKTGTRTVTLNENGDVIDSDGKEASGVSGSNQGNSVTGNAILVDGYIVLGVRFGSPTSVKLGGSGFRLVGAEVDGEFVNFDSIKGILVGDELVISTDYSISVQTYVSQDESFIEIDLSESGIIAEPGILEASLVYKGTEVSKVSKVISSLGGLEEQYLISKSVRDIQKSGLRECESSIEVERCVVDLNPADVLNDEINTERITKIIHKKCNEVEIKEIKCSEKKPISVEKKVTEEESGRESYEEVDVYDSDSGTLVANVVYDSKRESLDIDFLQSPQSYQDSCHNGLWDGDEEGKDCGGNCSNECKTYGLYFRVIAFVLVLGLIIFLFVRKVSHGSALNKGSRALDKGNLGGAVNAYRKVQKASASGRLSKEESKKARSFYFRLRRRLSSKGVKVSSEKGKGLPKLFYSK